MGPLRQERAIITEENGVRGDGRGEQGSDPAAVVGYTYQLASAA